MSLTKSTALLVLDFSTLAPGADRKTVLGLLGDPAHLHDVLGLLGVPAERVSELGASSSRLRPAGPTPVKVLDHVGACVLGAELADWWAELIPGARVATGLVSVVPAKFPPVGVAEDRAGAVDPDQDDWHITQTNAQAKGNKGGTTTVGLIDSRIDPSSPPLYGRVEALEVSAGTVINQLPDVNQSHATTVASVIASVAPLAKIKSVAALTQIDATDGRPWGTVPDVIYALNYLADASVDVINLAFQIDEDSSAFDNAISNLMEKHPDLAIVAAAGNGKPGAKCCSPGSHPLVLSVGATDYQDKVADFSMRRDTGRAVPDLYAPGVHVSGTILEGYKACHDGTSIAAGVVTGILLRHRGEDRKTPIGTMTGYAKSAPAKAGSKRVGYRIEVKR